MRSKIGLLILCLVVAGILWPHRSGGQGTSTTVFYVATAVDSAGNESANSNETSCLLTSTKPKCDLSWTASTSTVAGYNIYKAGKSGGPYTKANAALISGLTYVDVYAVPNPPAALAGVPSN